MGLCYSSILAFLTSKLLLRSFSRMAFLVVDQSCLCLQRLIACFANILFSPFLSMHCAFVPNDRGGNQLLLADFTFKNLCQFVLTGPSFNSEAPENWKPLRKTYSRDSYEHMQFIRIYVDIRISAYTMRIFLCSFMRLCAYWSAKTATAYAHMKNNRMPSSNRHTCQCLCSVKQFE